MNADLAYFCGLLAGDGCISIRENKHEYLVNCGGNPKDEKEFYDKIVVPLVFDLFGIKAKVFSKKTYGINIWSKELVQFLLSLGLVRSPKTNLHFPEVFLNNQELAFSFIQGVADTDFSFKLRKGKYPIITGVSKSKRLLEEIIMLLEKNEFRVTKLYDYRVLDQRFKEGYNIINRFDINGHKQFALWIKLIGTKQPKNIQKLNLWIERNRENPKAKNLVEEVSTYLEK